MRLLQIALAAILLVLPAKGQDKPALDAIVKDLSNSNDAKRIAAIDALGKLGPDAKSAAYALCHTATHDFKPEICKLAGEAMAKVRPELAPHVVVLRDASEAAVLVAAANAVGKLGPSDGLAGTPALRMGLYRWSGGKITKEPTVAIACIDALGLVQPEDKYVIGEIGNAAVLNPDAAIRTSGARALGRIGAARPEQRKLVIGHLRIIIGTDRVLEVRLTAIRAVSQLGADGRKILAALTKDKNEDIRKAAAEALAAGDKKDQ